MDLVFDECYVPAHSGGPPPEPLGFVVAGFSPDARHPEAWVVEIGDATRRSVPRLLVDGEECGWAAFGQDEAIVRLLTGSDPALRRTLAAAVPAEHWPAVDEALRAPDRPMIANAMPFAEAIALATDLVDVTATYARLMPVPETVGGPPQVAGLTRHDGFTWIERQHYYPAHLNPTETCHAC